MQLIMLNQRSVILHREVHVGAIGVRSVLSSYDTHVGVDSGK